MKICCILLPLFGFCGSVSAFSARAFSIRPTAHLLYADARQDAFAAFADSLEETEKKDSLLDESWQQRLETLLDPTTSFAKRQVLLSELISSNDDIRNSVAAALRDRKVRIKVFHSFEYITDTHRYDPFFVPD